MRGYDYGSQDAPDVTELGHERPVARKQHVCASCKRPIEIGERHVKIVAIVDGLFESSRWHVRCTIWGGDDD